MENLKFALTKRHIMVDIERDSKQWPVSVKFTKNFGDSKAVLAVMRETDNAISTVSGSEKINYKVIEGSMAFALYERRGIPSFKYIITFPEFQQLEAIKSMIWNTDSEPLKQFSAALKMLSPGLSKITELSKIGSFTADYSIDRCSPATNTDRVEEAKMAEETCNRLLSELQRAPN